MLLTFRRSRQEHACVHTLPLPSAMPPCCRFPTIQAPRARAGRSGAKVRAPSVIESPMEGTTACTLSHSKVPVRMPRDPVGPGQDRAAVLG